MLTHVVHKIIDAGSQPLSRRFHRALHELESQQKKKLSTYLKMAEETTFGRDFGLTAGMSWETALARVPVQSYTDIQGYVERQRSQGTAELSTDCQRYQPTSGSTSARKWIPYNRALLAEFSAAASPWICDLAKAFPATQKGRHYWSLSWLPSELRAAASSNDDRELFPWWKQILLKQSSAVPTSVSEAPSVELSMFATACHLAATRDLSFISIWSPTFFLALLNVIETNRFEIAQILREGRWASPALKAVPCAQSHSAAEILETRHWDKDIWRRLWPSLALISAWDTGSSAHWSNALRAMFPETPLQGKGLWATEGVVTIPLAGQNLLALTSHVYEFIDIDSGRVLAPWQLRVGQEVQPLITTGGGLWRYKLEDRLKVTGFLFECPAFRFMGRMRGVDLVGEKLDDSVALGLLEAVRNEYQRVAVCLMGLIPREDRPHYLLLVEGPLGLGEALAGFAEKFLLRIHHYQLARQLEQLGPVQVLCSPRVLEFYTEVNLERGIVRGDIKIEPILSVKEESVSTVMQRMRGSL